MTFHLLAQLISETDKRCLENLVDGLPMIDRKIVI